VDADCSRSKIFLKLFTTHTHTHAHAHAHAHTHTHKRKVATIKRINNKTPDLNSNSDSPRENKRLPTQI